MSMVLFILGHACSGKSTLAEKWLTSRLELGEAWALMDKDTIGDTFSKAMLRAAGMDENDRDSPYYKMHIRDLEYQACLDVIKEQLKHNIHVVVPGPWTKEIISGSIFNVSALGLPSQTNIQHIYLDISEQVIKTRLIERARSRDAWKLANWEHFAKNLKKPENIMFHNVLTFTDDDNETQLKLIEKHCLKPTIKL